MITSWERTEGRRTYYILVHYNEIVVGSHYGTGMSDNAGSCSHEAFLEGEFQDLVLENFDQAILDEVIFAIKHTHENVYHNEKRTEIERLKSYIETIPIDKTLLELKNHPDTIDGSNTYGNKGHYKSYIESDTTTFFYSSTKGHITSKETSEVVNLKWKFHASSCVELHDTYYLIGNDNLQVISKEGEIIYSSERDIERDIFGSTIRISRVFKNEETIFISYWTFDKENLPDGLIRFELGKGFTGRMEFED